MVSTEQQQEIDNILDTSEEEARLPGFREMLTPCCDKMPEKKSSFFFSTQKLK